MSNLRPSLLHLSASSRGRSLVGDGTSASAFTRGVGLRTVAIALSILVSGTVSSIASELQPPEAGAQPLRDRLAVVEVESKSLEVKLSASGLPTPEREKLLKQLSVLAIEKGKLVSELKSVEELSRSPYVTFARPPNDAN